MSVEWVFFAFTLDDSNANFYKNGVETFSSPVISPSQAVTQGNLEVGRNTGGRFEFTGLIDDIAVYNRTFTGDEISSSIIRLFQSSEKIRFL